MSATTLTMIAMMAVVPLVSTAPTQALDDDTTLTDQAIEDRLDQLNTFMQAYLENIKIELESYKTIPGMDKNLKEQIEATEVITKLVKQSWLHSMKPDERYYVPPVGKSIEKVEKELELEIKDINKKCPIADAILLYTEIEEVIHLEKRKKVLEKDIQELDDKIAKNKEAGNLDEADNLEKWKNELYIKLQATSTDIRQFRMIREMFLQSYVLDLDINSKEKILKITHSSGDEEKAREFPMPQRNTLSVLQEIQKS